MNQDIGRAPSGQALVASDEAGSRLHPSGFDPSRLPEGSGICAFDLDEITVTIALNTVDDVYGLLKALPHRCRRRVCQ